MLQRLFNINTEAGAGVLQNSVDSAFKMVAVEEHV